MWLFWTFWGAVGQPYWAYWGHSGTFFNIRTQGLLAGSRAISDLLEDPRAIPIFVDPVPGKARCVFISMHVNTYIYLEPESVSHLTPCKYDNSLIILTCVLANILF